MMISEHMTRQASSTLAALLSGAEEVEHWRDSIGVTWLRFIGKGDDDVWVRPGEGENLAFVVAPKERA